MSLPSLSLDERLTFAGAGALMGKSFTVWTMDLDTAKRARRILRALKLPGAIRQKIRVKVADRRRRLDADYLAKFEAGVFIQ